MATAIIMPKFGMTQTEATVVRWLCEEGARVQTGDPLLEVETDKVNMEVESPASGVLANLSAQPGQVVPVTAIIGYIVQPGESAPAAADAHAEPRRVTPLARRLAAEAGVNIADIPAQQNAGRVTRSDVAQYVGKPKATPAARRVAHESGVDLGTISGSGPDGRIQARDVQAAAAARPMAQQTADADQIVPLQGMRRTIAQRMQASYQAAPHITLTVEADMSAAEALRQDLNGLSEKQQGPHVTISALLVKVCAWALRRHPLANASLQDDGVHLHAHVNVGVAVALEEGLIVPVLRDADRLGVADIARQMDDLGARTRQGQLAPDDVTGGTFTISNLGMFGVKHFTAIINPPEAAILAVGRIQRRPMVADGSDAVIVRPMMEMTLSADHRVLDGAVAARFLADVVLALEHPSILLW